MKQLKQNKKNLLIIAALKNEINPVKFYFKDFALLNLKTHFLVTGIGNQKSIKKLTEYCKNNKPDYILNIGTCGSMSDDYKIGDVFIPCEVINLGKNIAETLKLNIHNYEKMPITYKIGKLISSEIPIVEKTQKVELQKLSDADTVDMETFWIAEFCQQQGIAFSSIKVVSDFAENVSIKSFKKQLEKIANLLIEPVEMFIKMVENNGK